ncbi:4Fe-4S cluster-binding domain-containing protein [Dictyoglomus thermophilum]|uniref:4Fe-4S cluster-binding domain-containing protein n=1 Tax=Dictyoglomus thermophilum (strain ATCC 35947 / DSM 3960 / H-6-12) TaxID=309799 RepID=B5YC10_DICT6|nr:4Fe-4S cluster-binding domain-containing protein [Dictyoglomus thermophilum]ACI18610.1 hypothetical protein DICTH_0235 [Dictyoglomus thermophilum H-6-12]
MNLPLYLDFDNKKIHPNGWEVVYFLNPSCSGSCAHCWSYNKFLGFYLPTEWHINFWRKVDFNKLREIRLTGGEPLEYKGLSEVIKILTYKNFERSIPIYIFTSGRRCHLFKKRKGRSKRDHRKFS